MHICDPRSRIEDDLGERFNDQSRATTNRVRDDDSANDPPLSENGSSIVGNELQAEDYSARAEIDVDVDIDDVSYVSTPPSSPDAEDNEEAEEEGGAEEEEEDQAEEERIEIENDTDSETTPGDDTESERHGEETDSED
ncbi:hypothetical protein TI39_contig342g00001 [Zymoseptoria brevis]|uniref:Uncharacterized protein n=1 Tax=Zymoseptoria brevis TaxID=1047168 RepID=A0A0F4GRT8_9PEZI|nr:hypothetical protein TI39_contig342g00001 [Zymoseptoria brevis]